MKTLLHTISEAELKNLQQLDDLCDTVKEYYANNERHKYSEISAYLMENADVDYLLENLRRIQERFNEKPEDAVTAKKVFKLIDHITLELNRTKYNAKSFEHIQIKSMNAALASASQKIQEVTDVLRREQSEKLDEEIKSFTDETHELKNKIEDSYTQFVSILGIFSAIVLVFFGGMTAFSSIFANMQNINRFKLVFVTCVVGEIVFNLIFMFLYILAKLLGREIVASTAVNPSGKYVFTKWIKRIWVRYPYILLFNIIMFLMMMGSYVSWYLVNYCGWRL